LNDKEYPYTYHIAELITTWCYTSKFYDSLTWFERELLRVGKPISDRILDPNKKFNYNFTYTEKERSTYKEIREKWIEYLKKKQ
jgi:hypothetical protein